MPLIAVPCFLASGAAGAQQKPAAAKQSSHEVRIGDVQILTPRSVRFKADFSSATVTGPNTILLVQDKKSKSVLRLHADTIQSHKVQNDPAGLLDLLTNVRFHIDRENGSSASGTATEGHYVRADHKLTLLEAHVTITDPASLDGPAALIASRIVVDMSSTPYLYTLTGDPGIASIHATPIGRKKRPSVGEVYATKFRSAVFQAGSHATVDGAGSTFSLHDAAGRKDTLLRATHLQAKFDSAQGEDEIVSATAQGDVFFSGSRVCRAGDVDTLTANGDTASYDSARDRAEITGGVTAEIKSPASLESPGHIQARSLTISFPDPETYEITGGPNASHLDFVPKPRAAKPADPHASAVPEIRQITVKGFAHAQYAPTASLDVTGPSTVFELLNLTTSEAVTLASTHITGKMSDKRELLTAAAAEGVQFRDRIPATAQHAERSLNGHAAAAQYNAQASPSSLALNGPLKIEVVDPDNLEGPGHISGETGDTLTAYATPAGYDYDMTSPAETGEINVKLRSRTDSSTPQAAPRKTKPVKKQGKKRGDKN